MHEIYKVAKNTFVKYYVLRFLVSGVGLGNFLKIHAHAQVYCACVAGLHVPPSRYGVIHNRLATAQYPTSCFP